MLPKKPNPTGDDIANCLVKVITDFKTPKHWKEVCAKVLEFLAVNGKTPEATIRRVFQQHCISCRSRPRKSIYFRIFKKKYDGKWGLVGWDIRQP